MKKMIKLLKPVGFFKSKKLLSCKPVCFCYYSWVSLSLFLTLGSLVPSNFFKASELSQFMGSLAERRRTLAVFGQAL